MEYMSKAGFDKLNDELNYLVKERLPEAIHAIQEGRDKGDLSENFEYHAAKREQGRVLRRISYLQKVLANVRVIPDSDEPVDSVQLLTTVKLTNMASNRTTSYTIVSPHEANTRERKISVKSPIAQAILNKREGEVVEVKVPAGIVKLRIDGISR